jgi:hypothetical protein
VVLAPADTCAHRLLPVIARTAPFADYCRLRGIRVPTGVNRDQSDTVRRWGLAVARLPRETRPRIELELGQVEELSGPDANAHLVESAAGEPLPTADVPAGPALALWFLVHRPDVFREVYFHHEVRELDCWRAARAKPRLALADPDARAARLAASVGEFFRKTEGTGQFVTAATHRDGTTCYFAVRVSDRLRLFDGFTAAGEPGTQPFRPAVRLLFAYRADGVVQLQCRVRAADRVADLFRRFGEAALGCRVVVSRPLFDLDRLKAPFRPLPDAADMECVRVRALHLCYPGSAGRRAIKLETVAADRSGAIEQLLTHHAGHALARLRVCFAELQVRLRVNGRSKNYPVRLWPDRCDLDHTPLGERLRRCLARWGLSHDTRR